MRAHALNAQDLGDPRAPGSALIYAYIRVNLRSAPDTVGIVKGGMGAITQAMARAAGEAGVTIRTGVEVARVDVRNGRAAGVVLADGSHIAADVVVSNADPKRTFLRLVPPDALPADFREQIASALDPGGLLQVPRGAPRAARLLRVPRARLRSALPGPGEDLPVGRGLPRRVARRPGGPAAPRAADGGADPVRLRRLDGAARPPRRLDLGALGAGAAGRRHVGDAPQGDGRADDRSPDGATRRTSAGRSWTGCSSPRRTSRRGSVSRTATSAISTSCPRSSRPASPAGLGALPHAGRGPLPVRRRHPSGRRGHRRPRAQRRARDPEGRGRRR